MHHALEAAVRLGCDAVQVFLKNQRQWRTSGLDSADLERWHVLLSTGALRPPIAHATYLINLATPDPTLSARSRALFAEELRRCEQLGIPYLVVHPGSAGGSSISTAIARVSKALNHVFAHEPTPRTTTLLETTAGQGRALGRSFDELAAIIAGTAELGRVGVCIDTCHVFAAGYDIRRPDGYEDMIALAARTVGLDRVRCWHMNDSRYPCGSHVDRHAHIGRGKLGRAAFANILGDPRFRGVPMILETPKGHDARGRDYDATNLRRLRAIAAAMRGQGPGGA
jgi:deoxyribonuclease-4